MDQKDYYVTLGVTRGVSPAGIRQAFRALVRLFHPDRVGVGGRRAFQEIVEAYRVLSDAERRASYDRGLRHAAIPEPPPSVTSVTAITPRPSEPEPLVPDTISVMRDFVVTRPSFDEVHERFASNFTDTSVPRSRQLDALRLQVIISCDQAARGGVLTLGVPVFYPCVRCRSMGQLGSFSCGDCGGTGIVEEEEPVRVPIPPLVEDGAEFQLPLRGLGIHNMYLHLRVRVTE